MNKASDIRKPLKLESKLKESSGSFNKDIFHEPKISKIKLVFWVKKIKIIPVIKKPNPRELFFSLISIIITTNKNKIAIAPT